MPSGIPYIVGNEAAERFSYYGMRAILILYMTENLLGASGNLNVMSEVDAKFWYHLFLMSVYLFPLMGAVLADAWLGKYRTIFCLSLVYCLGHFALSADETRLGLFTGLLLIAIGSGGIKPCVSANVGDQFGAANRHLIERVFGWFYLAINLGALASSWCIPWLRTNYGPRLAFAVPGVLMVLATFIFWLGRRNYVHAPPAGLEFLRAAWTPAGRSSLSRLAVLYAFVMVFWCLYDQTSSAWILQAKKMDLHLGPWHPEPAQTHMINPLLILLFVPLFSYVIYPTLGKLFVVTPVRKMMMGFFLTACAFTVSAVIESWITGGSKPNLIWQVLAYVLMTAAEVMVSVTGLEYSYTQAPRSMKSLVMAFWLFTVAAGNLMTSLVNWFAKDADGNSRLVGETYYWFFVGLMVAALIVYIPVCRFFLEKPTGKREPL